MITILACLLAFLCFPVKASNSVFENCPKDFDVLNSGSWKTILELQKDGAFKGQYTVKNKSNNGGEEKSKVGRFSGQFGTPVSVSDTIYTLPVENILYEVEPGKEFTEDGMHYISALPKGFEEAEEFTLYLPGTPLDDMKKDHRKWALLQMEHPGKDKIVPEGMFFLGNNTDGTVFCGKKENLSTVISSLNSTAPGQFQVRWELVKGVDGYQIRFGTDPDFSKDSFKTASVESGKSSHTRTDATPGTTYYVGVRTYVMEGEEKQYSGWSETENVEILSEGAVIEELTEPRYGQLKPLKTITVDYDNGLVGGIYEFHYNELGLIEQITDTYGDTVFTYSFTYDEQGRMISKTAGIGLGMEAQTVVTREYDDAGQLVRDENLEYDYYDESQYSYVEGSRYPIGVGTDNSCFLFLKDTTGYIIYAVNLVYPTSFLLDDEGYPTGSADGCVRITYDESNWSSAPLEDTSKVVDSETLLEARPQQYIFSSGAGAWRNILILQDDWTFCGEYLDSDMGDTGPDYPNGTSYLSVYKGKFYTPVQLTPYSYQLKLESLELENAEGSEYIEDGIRTITKFPYGLEDTQEFTLFLPGTPLSSIPEDSIGWMGRNVGLPSTSTTVPEGIYLLCNNANNETFCGNLDNDDWEKTVFVALDIQRNTENSDLWIDSDWIDDDWITGEETSSSFDEAQAKSKISAMGSCLSALVFAGGGYEDYYPSVNDGKFWEILTYYTGFEQEKDSSIYFDTSGDRARYMISKGKLLSAAFFTFPDFSGIMPETDGMMAVYTSAGNYGMMAGQFGDERCEIAEYSFHDNAAVVTMDDYYYDSDGKHSTYYYVYLKEAPELEHGYQVQFVSMAPDKLSMVSSEPVSTADQSVSDVADLSEEQLLEKLSMETASQVLASYYDDYDANGTKELFAVTGQPEDNNLWFVSSQEVEQLVLPWVAYYENADHICPVSGGKKLFIMESGGFGSGSTSNCYYVVDDKVQTVGYAGEGLTHLEGDDFAVHPSAFDALTDPTTGMEMGGHTWKRYYIHWNGSGFDEYVGTEITQDALLQYAGASDILQQAWDQGYNIGTIISRENGIINVNLYRLEEGSQENQNLTLQVEGQNVSLVEIYTGIDNWMLRYSYGGIYRTAGF